MDDALHLNRRGDRSISGMDKHETHLPLGQKDENTQYKRETTC